MWVLPQLNVLDNAKCVASVLKKSCADVNIFMLIIWVCFIYTAIIFLLSHLWWNKAACYVDFKPRVKEWVRELWMVRVVNRWQGVGTGESETDWYAVVGYPVKLLRRTKWDMAAMTRFVAKELSIYSKTANTQRETLWLDAKLSDNRMSEGSRADFSVWTNMFGH